MTIEQFNYSNTFWDDRDWGIDMKIPKEVVIDGDDVYFKYLNKKELKDFINIKANEDNNLLIKEKVKRIKEYKNEK